MGQNVIDERANAFTQSRRRLADTSNLTILATCTRNNSTATGGCTVEGEDPDTQWCWFYVMFGDSCFSSYMTWGFGLVVFLLLPFLYLGCYTLADVTTPLRVPTRILPVRKEY